MPDRSDSRAWGVVPDQLSGLASGSEDSVALVTAELTDDTCDACGFDSSARSRDQAIAVVAGASELIDDALGARDAAALNERADDETWSPLEYVEHVREVFLHNRLICEQALTTPGTTFEGAFPPAMSERPATLDRVEVLSALRDEAERNAELFRLVGDDQWANAGVVSGMGWTLRFALAHLCHELLHHRSDIAAGVGRGARSSRR